METIVTYSVVIERVYLRLQAMADYNCKKRRSVKRRNLFSILAAVWDTEDLWGEEIKPVDCTCSKFCKELF